MFIEHLLCARCGTVCFRGLVSWNPRSRPKAVASSSFPYFTDEHTEAKVKPETPSKSCEQYVVELGSELWQPDPRVPWVRFRLCR